MKETDLQDKYVMKFLCEQPTGLRYREVKANTVSPQFFVVEDLRRFLAESSLNEKSYKALLAKYPDEKALLAALTEFLSERIAGSANMAVFFHTNTTVTFESVKLHLFYPSGGVTDASDKLFEENIFSVVQELPYAYKHGGGTAFQFRPDLTFFLNGIFLGYSELKSSYNNQTAAKNGRRKVGKDYLTAVQAYLKLADGNDASQRIRRDMLKIFEKAIHITSTDLEKTYIIRNIAQQFDELKAGSSQLDAEAYQKLLEKDFSAYPLRHPEGTLRQRFEEVFRALYDKRMIEKEILYYNFLEREFIKKDGKKEYKHSDGRLISPRPKQKFGTDKVIDKIDELLAHEAEPDYFIKQLGAQLKKLGVADAVAQELIAQRQKYHNNKYVYSLLLQYAAGFGKSNIIGWLALQLKDLRRSGAYVYDKVLIVVDRLQLRDQLDTKMHNMNIQNSMFVEADSKATFLAALSGDTRIVVVNLQKFGDVANTLPPEVLAKLSSLRVAFLIDEIHRSNSGDQNAAMLDLFEELQTALDKNAAAQPQPPAKKNLLVGFTATPSDHTLARFGEFSRYAENMAYWRPFDSFTMREAIEAGFILNPLDGVVPVSAKMYFELPDNVLAGFEGDTGYDIPADTDTGIDAEGRKYAIRKKLIYQNDDRIRAIAKFVVERLVGSVYPTIKGYAKAMLAVSSIPAAIKYVQYVRAEFAQLETTQPKKFERFKEAPIHIVYSDSQEHPAPASLNDGLSEAQVMQNFAVKKNGLIIVVDKLQTGFDEPKLHTLFLDKEIRDINAIQTISRVNRKIKNKNECKVVDFSYKNVNVKNIKDAFAKFSNVVVSDFDPLSSEQQLAVHYDDLREHALFIKHFTAYTQYQPGQDDITPIMELEEAFIGYIKTQPEEAKKLKRKIGKYFRILNLIAFVLDIDAKFTEEHFLRFWRRYNHEYNSLHRGTDLVDDVEIYFDHYLGIVAPADYDAKVKSQPGVVSEDASPYAKKYKYDILRVIEKRNQQEEAIEFLIKEFEAKIDQLFDFIRTDNDGKRIVAKMKSTSTHFDAEEIYDDFAKVYRKFVRRNKDVGEFFVRETKDILTQLCDDFEKLV